MNETKHNSDTYLHDTLKTYRVVRLALRGYGMTVPEKDTDGSYICRTIRYETIEFGGKKYQCAKDHQERVIYIDTQAMEEAVESSG